jgi:D-lactate dehydrogenase (quinone)
MELPTQVLQALNAIVSEGHLMTDPTDCWLYSYDNGCHRASPSAVVFARSHREVSKIVKCCNDSHISIVVRGRGSNAPCNGIPVLGGVVLSLERMDKILSADFSNKTMVVQAGVLNQAIQNAAAAQGFCWTPTASHAPTIIEQLNNNAAGPSALKHGPLREHVLELKVVLGNGNTICTGASSSYDFTSLLLGTEATLGIITEANLKLTPLSDTKKLIQLMYHNDSNAIQALLNIMSLVEVPSSIVFLDQASVQLSENAGSILLIEADESSCEPIIQSGRNPGLINAAVAENPQQAKELCKVRRLLSAAVRKLVPRTLQEDVMLPLISLPSFFTECTRLATQYEVSLLTFGHVSNNHRINLNLLINHRQEQQSHAETCLHEIFNLVIKLNGTLLGEQGFSSSKRVFIDHLNDPTTLNLMRAVKQQFDPHNILNPGKVFLN